MREKIQLLARLLVDNGLTCAFGVTGSGSSLALITELERLGVQYYPASHEASAALMAGAASKVKGRISASISIKGPGLVNMVPGIAYNHFENLPAVSISEAFGDEVPSYQRHKRLNHAALLSPIVKGIISLEELDKRLSPLLDAARSEIPGPVHLELCVRHGGQGSILPLNREDPCRPGQRSRNELFRFLRKSERPILIVGSLASRREWQEKLASLMIPVFTTVSAKGVLNENLPHSAGVFTGRGKELAPESHLFAEADLVVGIGLRNTEVLAPKPLGKPTIILDETNDDLAQGFGADLDPIGADPELVSEVLIALKCKNWGSARIDSLRRRMRKSLLHATWLPAVCFQILNDLGFPYTLVLDAGAFCTVAEHLWQARPDRSFIGSSISRYMGVAIPCAVGTALCNPGLPVFCVVGDGGIRTYPSEIKLAVEEKLPVCFILMTDGAYGSVACASRSRAMSRRAVTVYQPSWWKSVEAMLCESYALQSEDAFTAKVQRWDRRGPLFIEAKFDPTAYSSMIRQLR